MEFLCRTFSNALIYQTRIIDNATYCNGISLKHSEGETHCFTIKLPHIWPHYRCDMAGGDATPELPTRLKSLEASMRRQIRNCAHDYTRV